MSTVVHLLTRRLLWPLLCRLGRHEWEYSYRRIKVGGPPWVTHYDRCSRRCRRCGQMHYVSRAEYVAAQATGRARD